MQGAHAMLPPALQPAEQTYKCIQLQAGARQNTPPCHQHSRPSFLLDRVHDSSSLSQSSFFLPSYDTSSLSQAPGECRHDSDKTQRCQLVDFDPGTLTGASSINTSHTEAHEFEIVAASVSDNAGDARTAIAGDSSPGERNAHRDEPSSGNDDDDDDSSTGSL
jgi:hypothetical protein